MKIRYYISKKNEKESLYTILREEEGVSLWRQGANQEEWTSANALFAKKKKEYKRQRKKKMPSSFSESNQEEIFQTPFYKETYGLQKHMEADVQSSMVERPRIQSFAARCTLLHLIF